MMLALEQIFWYTKVTLKPHFAAGAQSAINTQTHPNHFTSQEDGNG